MYAIELIPDNLHCIETIARKEYKDLSDNFLRSGKHNADLEAKFELLRGFLNQFDFRKLRQDSDNHFQKGQRIKFVIYVKHGTIKYRIVPI